MVKKFLDELGVDYDFRDVLNDEAAAREFVALGGRVPPLTVVDGHAIHGFTPDEIESAVAAMHETRQ